MKIERTCETCQLGFDPFCEPQKDSNNICINWEPEIKLFEEMVNMLPEKERNKFLMSGQNMEWLYKRIEEITEDK